LNLSRIESKHYGQRGRDWTGIGRTPATRPRYQLLYGLLLEAG